VASARRIMLQSVRWAESEGHKVRLAQGQECITWPDGSQWVISSESGVYGFAASEALLDEAWDLDLEKTVQSAIIPVLVEREQSQLILLSTAHPEASATMPHYRRLAMAPDPRRTMLAEWGAADDADPHDPMTWRLSSAHWTEQREELMSDARHTKSFGTMWLNKWPSVVAGVAQWLPAWDSLPTIPADSSEYTVWPVGACEMAVDRSCVGVAVARRRDDGRIEVRSRVMPEMDAALAWLNAVPGLQVVMAGASIKELVYGTFLPVAAGLKETRFASPWLSDAVARGIIVHDHDAATAAQVKVARTADTEYGVILSQKRSAGPIPAVKAIAWAGIACSEDWHGFNDAPQIF